MLHGLVRFFRAPAHYQVNRLGNVKESGVHDSIAISETLFPSGRVMPRDRQPAFSILSLFRHPVVLFLTAAALVIAGAMGLWNRYGSAAQNEEMFRVTADTIHFVNQEPLWANTSVKELLLMHLREKTTLDPQLVPQAAQVVLSAGWVEHVNEIRKSKDRLSVDVRFREPVAAVVTTLEEPLMPVDQNGILMDNQLFQQRALDSLPRIAVFSTHQLRTPNLDRMAR